VVALKKAGYRVGIVTDSYNVSAEIVRRRVFADFAFSHFMRFKNGKASGRFHICPAMIHPDGCLKHDHCKVNVIHHLVQHCDLTADQILAVGDGENDICMLKAAGCSVAFLPKTKRVRGAAKFKATLLQEIPFFAGATLLRKTNRESTSDASDSSNDLRDAVSN